MNEFPVRWFGNFQFLWWGEWRGLHFNRVTDTHWRAIYRWFLIIGPLEIRKWAVSPTEGE